MNKTFRWLNRLAVGLLLLGATGCHYDYGYYSVGYSTGYDCSPRYHSTYRCDYSYTNYYHAPCDGIRFRTDYVLGHSHHYRRGH